MPIYSNRRRSLQGVFNSGDPAQVRMTYPHPAAQRGMGEDRQKFYEQMFQYYSNTAFDEVSKWASYKRKYNLYRYTRGIFNPFARLVDFYSDHVYPGVLSAEDELPNGIQSAIPLAHNTPPELREAIAQTWQWSNWQVHKSTMVTYGGMVGNCLVEVVDDVLGGNVRFRVVWPGFVKDFSLDDFGNLDSYVLEYDALNTNGDKYKFTKEVTRSTIKTYSDDQQTSSEENPYPFVPAVWVKHVDIGSDFGLNAMKGGLPKFDELNSVVSHTADHIHKQVNSPRILWAGGQVKSLFKNQEVDDADFDNRNDILLLKGDKDGRTDTLVGNLDPATIVPIIDRIIKEIEADHPEIVVYQNLREQNIVTGPGARLQMGDVEASLQRPAANYDSASARLFQMAVAIGGWRVSNGDWGVNLTTQQRKFLSFDFDSYNAGQLDVTILPRPLFKPSSTEIASEMQMRGQAVASVQNILPLKESYEMLGYREDQIEDMIARWKKEQQEKTDQAIKQAQATKPQSPAPGGGGNKE